MHTPVLLRQVIEALNVHSNGLYIDATLGEGGHFIEMVNKKAKVLGIDWDAQQIKNLGKIISIDKGIFAVGNYANVEQIAKSYDFLPVDGVLFDLGLSMAQLSESGRGFSYKALQDPLDMRIGNVGEETAADFLNRSSKDELYDIFAKYSEDLDSAIIAEEVIGKRKGNRIVTVKDFVQIVHSALGHCHQHKEHTVNKTLTRVFQALRIIVNDEFNNIRKGLAGAVAILKPEGRVAIISFHSLEDRVIKQFVREHGLKVVKTIKGDKELAFERSATLRVFSK